MTDKTHFDYLHQIGETAATAKSFREKRWNQYYFETSLCVVGDMLEACSSGTLIDVGTSHGNWFPFFRSKGFRPILGIELDQGRAELARQCGYDRVYNCDAASVPHAENSIDVAVSNDVFVHILRREDKIAVLREMQRLLKPGGIFIFNHTMARAHGHTGYTVANHCSFLDLHELIALILKNTDFMIVDIKPGYFHLRNRRRTLKRILGFLIKLPGMVRLLLWVDYFYARRLPIDESEFAYVKLRKPTDNPV